MCRILATSSSILQNKDIVIFQTWGETRLLWSEVFVMNCDVTRMVVVVDKGEILCFTQISCWEETTNHLRHAVDFLLMLITKECLFRQQKTFTEFGKILELELFGHISFFGPDNLNQTLH